MFLVYLFIIKFLARKDIFKYLRGYNILIRQVDILTHQKPIYTLHFAQTNLSKTTLHKRRNMSPKTNW